LDLQNVSRTYAGPEGPVVGLKDASLRVAPGEFTAVRGPSGCGKSTLLLTCGGLLTPDRGRAVLAGQDLYALSHDARARFTAQHVGFVFQRFHLIPYLSVLDNVMVPGLAVPSSRARSRAEELIERFGLKHRSRHVPGQLSTGERQRTALARALLNEPKVILADEPTGNLDPDSAEAVFRYLSQFVADGGAVLMVTHDAQSATVADRVVQMADGVLAVPSALEASGG